MLRKGEAEASPFCFHIMIVIRQINDQIFINIFIDFPCLCISKA